MDDSVAVVDYRAAAAALARSRWRRREGVELSQAPYGPPTGFKDQRRHRAPSSSVGPRARRYVRCSIFAQLSPIHPRQVAVWTDTRSSRDAREQPRALPSVDSLLASPAVPPLLDAYGRLPVIKHCRSLLESLRARIRESAPPCDIADAHLSAALEARRVADVAPVGPMRPSCVNTLERFQPPPATAR